MKLYVKKLFPFRIEDTFFYRKGLILLFFSFMGGGGRFEVLRLEMLNFVFSFQEVVQFIICLHVCILCVFLF